MVEHTKSEAGSRTIYVVSSALEIFDRVREANLQRGFSCDAEDYIFLYCGNRIPSQAIAKKYDRYCHELSLVRKNNHKARKTCLTKIADNPNINLKDAIQFSGHRDIQTYLKRYCFSRYLNEQKRIKLEKTLNVGCKKTFLLHFSAHPNKEKCDKYGFSAIFIAPNLLRNMGLEPIRLAAQEPKSCMSANSINSAGILPHQYSRFPLPCQSVWGGTAVSPI